MAHGFSLNIHLLAHFLKKSKSPDESYEVLSELCQPLQLSTCTYLNLSE